MPEPQDTLREIDLQFTKMGLFIGQTAREVDVPPTENARLVRMLTTLQSEVKREVYGAMKRAQTAAVDRAEG